MMSAGVPARKPPAFTASSIVGNLTVPAQPGIAHRRDLLVGQGPHQAQFAEHFHVLFVVRRGFADRLLAVLGEMWNWKPSAIRSPSSSWMPRRA